ncbi:hypothetical protein PoB_003794900 [Plakobranchus ocellatus]|uniref:Uncharacterized protein n=1 Tax=Plakobranchus ocellatus TaxID=259542 RepID=A0AAV4AZA3_9GAST|nr:hypothetical protein PoB_003794900 [Plakobranchus ocellatus]
MGQPIVAEAPGNKTIKTKARTHLTRTVLVLQQQRASLALEQSLRSLHDLHNDVLHRGLFREQVVYYLQQGLWGLVEGVGGTVASESVLRSAGTLLSRVRVPPPAPWPDGGSESLRRSPCCELTTPNQQAPVAWRFGDGDDSLGKLNNLLSNLSCYSDKQQSMNDTRSSSSTS